MSRNLIAISLFIFSGAALAQNRPAKPATVKDVSLRPITSGAEPILLGSSAEHRLLDLANQARLQTGVPPLSVDEGLTEAARSHAAAMASRDELSHQFSGEPALPQRVSAKSKLHFDRAGENVAYANTIEQAQEGLMHSPQHRENLLDPNYNVAGFAVVQMGPKVYVVQDFGHSLDSVSDQQAEEAVTHALAQMRTGANQPGLVAADGGVARQMACAMARADSLKTSSLQARYVLRYTAMQPDVLPSNASKIVRDPSINSFSAGSCYAKTTNYPNGAYWVVLIFN